MTSVRYYISLLKNNYFLSLLIALLLFYSFFTMIMSSGDISFTVYNSKLVNDAVKILGTRGLIGSIVLFAFTPIFVWKLLRKEINNSSAYIPLSYKLSRATIANVKLLAAISLYAFPFLTINLIQDITLLAKASDSSFEMFGRLFLDGLNYLLMICAWFSIVWFIFMVISNLTISILLVTALELIFIGMELVPLFLKTDSNDGVWKYLTITGLYESSIIVKDYSLENVTASIFIKGVVSVLLISIVSWFSNFYWFKKMDINL